MIVFTCVIIKLNKYQRTRTGHSCSFFICNGLLKPRESVPPLICFLYEMIFKTQGAMI